MGGGECAFAKNAAERCGLGPAPLREMRLVQVTRDLPDGSETAITHVHRFTVW